MVPIQKLTTQPAPILLLKSDLGEDNSYERELQSIIELFQEIFPLYQCLLWLWNNDDTDKICYLCQESKNTTILLNFISQLLEQNQSLLKLHKTIVCSRKKQLNSENLPVDSLLIIPLFEGELYLGEICLFSKNHQELWTKKDLQKADYLANQCVSNLRKLRKINYLNNELEYHKLIEPIHRQLNSDFDPEILLDEIIVKAGKFFQVEQVGLGKLDNFHIKIEYEWRVNNSVPSFLNRKITLDEWLALLEIEKSQTDGNWLKSLELFLVKEKFLNLEMGTIQNGYLVATPVSIRKNIFGFLILQSTVIKRDLLNESYQKQIQEIANLIGIIIYFIEHQETWLNQEIEKLKEEKYNLEKTREKNKEFLNHTVHELRSPLVGVLNFAKMLQEQIYGSLNHKQSEYIDVIVSSGQHLLSLVNDFLDLSKIEACQEEIILDTIPVEDICLASLAMVKGLAKETGIELKLEIDPEVDFCKADQKRIKQILVNLLTNALKFTEEGSVTLQLRLNQHHLEFSVIDTGIGIKKEDQEKLFQPFQQIKNHLSCQHKGTGLGLALSRRYAQLHGGDITFISEENKGSCFTLSLPL